MHSPLAVGVRRFTLFTAGQGCEPHCTHLRSLDIAFSVLLRKLCSSTENDQTHGGRNLIAIRQRVAAQLCLPGTIGIALLLTGCDAEGRTAPLPSIRTMPPTSPPSDDEAATTAYTNVVAQLDTADSLPADIREQELSRYMSDPQLSRVINRVRQLKAEHLTSYGKSIPHVQSVQIHGNKAILHDCLDAGNAGLQSSRTQKKVNRGLKKEGVKAHLSKGSDGQWRVVKIISLGEGC